VETRRANAARVYDYWLGGTHNFLADQDVARAIAAVEPTAPLIGRANRAFIGRAVRLLAANGTRQFLDIGSGIPTQGNVHEIAQQADPAARVAYVDIDPVAWRTARPSCRATERRDHQADLHEPARSRHHAADRPGPADRTAARLHPVFHRRRRRPPPHRGHPARRWRPRYLIISHGTNEDRPGVADAVEKVYNRSVAMDLRVRSRPEILQFFDGFDVVDPGLVYIPQWRPDPGADVPADPSRYGNLVGAGEKA
jgi:hypothetical protein